ncbi:hypothetical protein GCM10008090_13310 [Arenicella chitinivorans]|uniref:DUF2333 family protein n=1 Tax=Arenicella chitinivorans TaxID=1329800 RepID=A0A918RPE4_9GAMM|nr:DUF2333 family protein [Arenicella chitinivorans]GHA05088.1 hypothetical protein GCM10008090_13310 [Arenicella chitinivorans]
MAFLRHPLVIGVLSIIGLVLISGWYLDDEPEFQQLNQSTDAERTVVGSATTEMLIKTAETLLEKRGGYMSNDIMPPMVMMDNVPNWEFGVLQQIRDLVKAMRNDYSRSQTQSLADPDLEIAEPKFNVDSDAWMFPSAEGEYKEGIKALRKYELRLRDPNQQNAQFYARADNLGEWLGLVEKRLGSLSQRLSQARPQVRVNTDLAGDARAQQSTSAADEVLAKTSWFDIDDNFYEARGTAWALIHYLRAAEIDFRPVLEDKNAVPTLRQIIRELESTQQDVDSPMILNGSGMGMFANHSLVMSSYIGRANSAIADLRRLLADG